MTNIRNIFDEKKSGCRAGVRSVSVERFLEANIKGIIRRTKHVLEGNGSVSVQKFRSADGKYSGGKRKFRTDVREIGPMGKESGATALSTDRCGPGPSRARIFPCVVGEISS